VGHSSIQITVELYTHWPQRAEQKSFLEVDRLAAQPDGEGCTPDGEKRKTLGRKGEYWGGWMDDYRTFVAGNPNLNIFES